jgi:hypothetical protein
MNRCLCAIMEHPCASALGMPLNFCPHLRFYRAIAASYTEQFRRAESRAARDAALDGALTTAKMAVQVIAPLAEKQGPGFREEYLKLADGLFALARVSVRDDSSWQTSEANFPVQDDRQTMLAKIEQLSEKLDALKREMRGGK